jgi:putative hemolysin
LLDPDSTAPVIILAILFVLHIYFAAAKEAIVSVRKSRRLQLIEEGKSYAQKLDDLAEDPFLLLTTEQLILKPIGFLLVALVILVYSRPLALLLSISEFGAVLLATVLAAAVTLVLGELLPKDIARSYAEPVVNWTIQPFSLVSFLAKPLARLVTQVVRLLSGRWNEAEDFASTTITEEDLLSYVDVGEEEGVLKEVEKEMIYSIIDLDNTLSREVMVPRIDIIAREVMVPRIDIIAVEANTSIEKAIDVVIDAGHSRVPVFVDTIDNIVGILYVKDLLVYWQDQNAPSSIAGLERPVYFVPETKPVSDLLRELQSRRVHIAIVVDEYGGTAGLVTIEDVLEEIVGEIQDEHDAEEFYMEHISDDEYIFSARMDLDDINAVMDIELPTGESDTLGGLIYNVFGRIPKAGDSLSGESFDAPNLHFTVLDLEGRRIKTVKISRVSPGSGGSAELKSSPGQKTPTLINNTQKTVSESS